MMTPAQHQTSTRMMSEDNRSRRRRGGSRRGKGAKSPYAATVPVSLTSVSTSREAYAETRRWLLEQGIAGEAEIAAHIARWGADAGMETEVLEETNGRPSVLVCARGTGGGRSLLLCGHIDTVGVEGMADPHAPRIDGDRLYGRGAYDMKAGVAAALVAAREAAGRGLSGDVIVADGSGLSRYDYLTADALVAVLRRMAEPRHAAAFEPTLPIMGVDGTLERRQRGTALQGRIRAKTGSLSNVRALAGYATTRAGERLAFAIVANNYKVRGAMVDAVVDRALTALVAGEPAGCCRR